MSGSRSIKELISKIKQGNLSEILACLNSGTKINQHDDKGNTPLTIACKNNPEITELLLMRGADPELKEQHDGMGPLHYAINNPICLELLLRHKANVDIQSNTSTTPLMLASANRLADSVKILLEHKADVTLENNKKMNALKLAALGTAWRGPPDPEIHRILKEAMKSAETGKPRPKGP